MQCCIFFYALFHMKHIVPPRYFAAMRNRVLRAAGAALASLVLIGCLFLVPGLPALVYDLATTILFMVVWVLLLPGTALLVLAIRAKPRAGDGDTYR